MINAKDIIEKLKKVDLTTMECILQQHKKPSDVFKYIIDYDVASLNDYPRQQEMQDIVLKMQKIVNDSLIINV